MHRLIRIIAIFGISLLAVGWVAVWVTQAYPQVFAGTKLLAFAMTMRAGQSGLSADGSPRSPTVRIGGPFTLVDSTGKTVTDQTFRGRWMLLYFGYTYCPDVCPTELQTIASALDQLGPVANQIAPIFISIDPERDTPDALASYVKLFSPNLIGLTGTKQQIADVARAYRVYYAKTTKTSESAYLMDHSSLVYLMGPQGNFVALFNPQTSVDDMASELRNHLSQRG